MHYRTVTLDEVLCFLMAKTATPSTFGQQIEKLEAGAVGGKPADGPQMHAKATFSQHDASEAENAIFQQVSLIRCVDLLGNMQQNRVMKDKSAMRKLQAHSWRGQGELIVQCLRTAEEWRLRSEPRALAAVYVWAGSLDPNTYPTVLHDEADLTQAFMVGKAKAARKKAAELYADCLLVLGEFVQQWNLQCEKVREKARRDILRVVK